MGHRKRRSSHRARDIERSTKDPSMLLPKVPIVPDQRPWCNESSCIIDLEHRHGINCSDTCSECGGNMKGIV